MSAGIFLFFGFILLFLGGDFVVRGAVSLALRMRISTLVVGMTVVSFATSAPELFVSLEAVFQKSSNIALGNAIGSNIANIALVLGVSAIIFRVRIARQTLVLNYPMMLFSSILLGAVLYFYKSIPSIIGFLFLVILIVFLFLLIINSRKEFLSFNESADEILDNRGNHSILISLVILIIGILLLKYGSDYLVVAAKDLAISFGVSDRVIAVTIVAIGTSLPELSASIIAAFKKEDNLAVGNLIGSNIFNILAVLGITAFFQEIKIDDYDILNFDYLIMILITLIMGALIYFFSKQQISRKEGAVLLLCYVLYMYKTVLLVI